MPTVSSKNYGLEFQIVDYELVLSVYIHSKVFRNHMHCQVKSTLQIYEFVLIDLIRIQSINAEAQFVITA